MTENDPLVQIVSEGPGKISITFPQGTTARLKARVRLSTLLGALAAEVQSQEAGAADMPNITEPYPEQD